MVRVVGDEATQQHGEGRQPKLDDVGSGVKPSDAELRRRSKQAELVQEKTRSEPKAAKGRPEHVFGNEQLTVRADDDAVGAHGAVSDVLALRLKRRERGRELPDEPRDKRRVQACTRLRTLKHLGQPPARHVG